MRMLVMWFLLGAVTADARTLTEVTLSCDAAITVSLVAGPNDGDPPTLSVATSCLSQDATGAVLRTFRRDLASRLTTAQIQTLVRLLQRVPGTNAALAGIPTPQATPTDMPIRTPAPDPTG